MVLRGGKLLTITHGVIDDGVLVMSGGRIAAVGRASEVRIPRGAEIVGEDRSMHRYIVRRKESSVAGHNLNRAGGRRVHDPVININDRWIA